MTVLPGVKQTRQQLVTSRLFELTRASQRAPGTCSAWDVRAAPRRDFQLLTSPKPPFPSTLYCRNVFFVTGCLEEEEIKKRMHDI